MTTGFAFGFSTEIALCFCSSVGGILLGSTNLSRELSRLVFTGIHYLWDATVLPLTFYNASTSTRERFLDAQRLDLYRLSWKSYTHPFEKIFCQIRVNLRNASSAMFLLGFCGSFISTLAFKYLEKKRTLISLDKDCQGENLANTEHIPMNIGFDSCRFIEEFAEWVLPSAVRASPVKKIFVIIFGRFHLVNTREEHLNLVPHHVLTNSVVV